jgi:hypothetical protein
VGSTVGGGGGGVDGGAGGRVLGVHVISMGFACDIDVCTISTVGSGIARQCEADGLARPTAVVCVWGRRQQVRQCVSWRAIARQLSGEVSSGHALRVEQGGCVNRLCVFFVFENIAGARWVSENGV